MCFSTVLQLLFVRLWPLELSLYVVPAPYVPVLTLLQQIVDMSLRRCHQDKFLYRMDCLIVPDE